MAKQSSLYHSKTGPIFPVFEWSKTRQPSCFNHSKTGPICPVFEWPTSLDRFVKKSVIKKFFMTKRSRLEVNFGSHLVLAIRKPDKLSGF